MSEPTSAAASPHTPGEESGAIEARAFTAAPVLAQENAEEQAPEQGFAGAEPQEKRVTFDIDVSLMKGRSMPAHQVWLAPR